MPGKATTTIFSCCAALTVGLASMAAVVSASSQDARARVTGLVVQANVVASWGLNAYGELGDGTTADRSQPGDIRVGNDVVKVAAGLAHAHRAVPGGVVAAVPVCYFRASRSARQACSQRRQASPQTRQCSCIRACRSHSSPQLLQMATQASSSGRVTSAL